MRFLPTHFWIAAAFPILFSLNWAIADDIPFRDIRVMLAYVTVIVAIIVWLAGRRSKDPLVIPEAARPILAFAAVSYLVWLKLFAIYRYIVMLEMLGPLLVAIAIGLLPIPRRIQLITLALLFLATAATTHVEYIERSPISDPFVAGRRAQDRASGKGDGPADRQRPARLHRAVLPAQHPAAANRRLDGAAAGRHQDHADDEEPGRRPPRAHGGDLYVLSDAYDMGRTRDALVEYGLRIDWLKCTVFDTNIIGDYEFCPLFKWPRQ